MESHTHTLTCELGINLRFSDNIIEWNEQELDFCPDDLLEDDIFAVANIPDPISVEESIYDDAMQPSTYKAATTKDILPTLPHLTDEQKTILGKMLTKKCSLPYQSLMSFLLLTMIVSLLFLFSSSPR